MTPTVEEIFADLPQIGRTSTDNQSERPSRTQRPPAATTPQCGRWWRRYANFIDHGARTVSPAAALVWLTMYRMSADGKVRASVEQTADLTGLSARVVKRARAELVAAALVKELARGRRNHGCSIFALLDANPQGDADGPLKSDAGDSQGDADGPLKSDAGDSQGDADGPYYGDADGPYLS